MMLKTREEKAYFTMLSVFFLMMFSLPASAFAAGPILSGLQKILDIVTGPEGRIIAILAVCGFGYAAWAGHIQWKRALEVVIGIAIVFGADKIVDLFAQK